MHLAINDSSYTEWGGLSSFPTAPQDSRPQDETTCVLIASTGYSSMGVSLYLPEAVTYRFDVDDINWVAEPATTGVELSIIEYESFPRASSASTPSGRKACNPRGAPDACLRAGIRKRRAGADQGCFNYTGRSSARLYRSPLSEPIPPGQRDVSLCGEKPARQRISI